MRILLLVLLSSLAAFAADLAQSPIADRVKEYVRVFNTGDETAIKQWIEANYADSVLKERSAEQRLINFRRMKQDMGQIELHSVPAIEPSQTSVLLHTANDAWFQIGFMHDPQPPHKLFGLRVEQAEPPAEPGDPTPLRQKTALDSTRKMLERLVKADEFSGVVVIAKQGKPLFKQAYGLANRADNIRNTLETKFNLGSIDKTYTKIAIAHLMKDNLLRPDDKVGELLPDYPNKEVRSKVTVQQLLDHTSGVPDFFGEEFIHAPKDRVRSLQDYVPFFAEKKLNFEPGARAQYSNGGYVILGLIIERLSGKSYYDYIDEIIFQPFEMKNSGWFASDEIVPDRAVGYTRRWSTTPVENPELRADILLHPARGSSAGLSWSTAGDLLKFVNAIESGKLLSPEGKQLGIAGGAPGLNAAIETGVGGGYSIIVLCNCDEPAAERAARKIRGWLSRVK